MIGRATVIWLLFAVAAGFGLFQLKYEVLDQQRRLAELNARLVKNQEAIHVLRAEWSYLTAPERLQRLSERYLDMAPASAFQLGSFQDLPYRIPGTPERALAARAARPPIAATPTRVAQ